MSINVVFKRIVYSLILFLLVPICVSAQSKGNPFIKKFSPQEYGAHNQVWDITQTKEGFILISTGTGVVLFDGESFEMVKGTPAMITDLLTTSNGSIFYGGINNTGEIIGSGNSSFFYNKLDEHIDSTDQNYGQIGSIREAFGDVWISSRNLLFRYTGEHFQSYKPVNGEFLHIFSVNDTLFVPETGSGLLKISDQNELELFPGGEALVGDMFPHFIVPFDAHRVLIGTVDNGLYLFSIHAKGDDPAGILVPFENEANEMLKTGKVISAIQLRNGNYAIGTSTAGVIILKPNGQIDQIIDNDAGLQNEVINGLFQDRAGNLWISTNNGFALAEIASPIDFYNENNGLEGTALVVSKTNNDFYVSTTLGVYKMEGRNFVKNEFISALTFDVSNYQDPLRPGQEKLLAANQFGLYLVDNNSTQKLSEVFSSAVLQSTRNLNRIYAGTPNTVYSVDLVDGRFQPPGEHIVIGNPARQFLEDDRGGLWLATQSDGLRYFPDEFSKEGMVEFRTGDGYSVAMNATLQWINDTLFVTTIDDIYTFDYESNLFKLWRNSNLNEEEHLGIYRFLNVDGTVWTGTSNMRNQIFQYDGFFTDQPIKIKAPFRAIPESVTLWIAEIDGDIWFTNALGLFRYRNQSGFESGFNDVFLRQIDIIKDSTTVVFPTADVDLVESFSNARYRFTVAAPWFVTSGETTYRFRLAGYDVDWSDWGSTNVVEYTALREGDYTFMVQATNRDGQVSEITQYSLKITPPWFRTWWAFLTGILVIILLIIVISRYLAESRTRKLEAFNEKLEQQVRERSEEIQRQNQKLLEMNREKDDFMNIAAHDLRNPLTGVQGISSMMIDSVEIPSLETIQNYGEIIHNSSRRMFELIDTYLNAHRIDQGDIRPSVESVSLMQTTKSTVNSFIHQARKKEMSMEVMSTYEDVLVSADDALMQQILENIISNAIKYSPIGSKIEIKIDKDAEFGMVGVTDQGPGIPQEKQSELFKKFSKIGTVPTGDELSIGLGLSIAKQLTEMMRGSITCQSIPGKGSTFTIILRLAEE
ncbi:MAG TPA: hypothetical protein DCE78_11690 [Bacteroidetes bacterium]|nr:hypothetical protein [Bacteroidota bacterium]